MAGAPTYCVACDHVHPDTASKPPFQWRCMRHPAPPIGGFVDPNWRPDPPWHRCETINTGDCPDFFPKREMKTDVQP